MTMKPGFVLATAAVLALLCTPLVSAAMYMKIDGVPGESTARGHQDWIDIESMSSAVHLSPSAARGAGGTSQRRGDAVVEDISITKWADKSSPHLAEAVCKGKHFPKVEIHLTSTYGGSYFYELENVRITSYSVSASGAAGDVPTETLTLNFEEVKVTYDGTRGEGKPKSGWKVGQGDR